MIPHHRRLGAAALLIGLATAASVTTWAGQGAGQFAGKVVETMDAASYTYVRVSDGKEEVWAAGPKTPVKVGETVEISRHLPMRNFHSKSLDRTFAVLYFVGGIRVSGSSAAAGAGPQALPAGHPKLPASGDPLPAGHPAVGTTASAAVNVTGIKKADGGLTVAEVIAQRAALAGKSVTVRGKVVKANSNILGVNWYHVRDGSGEQGDADLTVTSKGTAKMGDVVLVKGKVAVDRDFGHGYRYGVLVEEAELSVETGNGR